MQENYCEEINNYIKNKNPKFYKISSTLDKNSRKVTESSKRLDFSILYNFIMFVDRKIESLFKENKKKEKSYLCVGHDVPIKEENMENILLEFNRCNNYDELKQNIDSAYNRYENRLYDEDYKEDKTIFQVNFNDFSSNSPGIKVETYALHNDNNPGLTDELFILIIDNKKLYNYIKDKDVSKLNDLEKSILYAMEDDHKLSEN